MLDTLRTNAAARTLLEHDKIHALRGAKILKAEVRYGKSRFDFLLDHNGRQHYLEVKSCTLLGEKVAMFPDAVTARGARHLTELGDLRKEGKKGAVLFLVHGSEVRHFMPDYHTDLRFAQTFLAVRDQVEIIPVRIQWEKDLTLRLKTHSLSIPWDYLERETQDRGSYLLVLQLKKRRFLKVGKLGSLYFRKGFYLYVGSAMKHLSKRLERHRRTRRRFHWHIDYLRSAADFEAALPIRSSERTECLLAKSLSSLAHWSVPNFGSSDCSCESHLFGFKANPMHEAAFQEMLLYYRMDRFAEKIIRKATVVN
jgi:sugar fermentation stimulation protein A